MIRFLLKAMMTSLTVFVLICGMQHLSEQGTLDRFTNHATYKRLHRGATVCKQKVYEMYQELSEPDLMDTVEYDR